MGGIHMSQVETPIELDTGIEFMPVLTGLERVINGPFCGLPEAHSPHIVRHDFSVPHHVCVDGGKEMGNELLRAIKDFHHQKLAEIQTARGQPLCFRLPTEGQWKRDHENGSLRLTVLSRIHPTPAWLDKQPKSHGQRCVNAGSRASGERAGFLSRMELRRNQSAALSMRML